MRHGLPFVLFVGGLVVARLLGGCTGSDAGASVPACTQELTADPDTLLAHVTVEGGTLVDGPAPEPYGGYPVIENGGCHATTVARGESFVIPLRFVDTRTPVEGCVVTLAGATKHILVDGGPCAPESFDALSGELPIRVTMSEDLCSGEVTLRYAMTAGSSLVSSYLETSVTVRDATATDGGASACR